MSVTARLPRRILQEKSMPGPSESPTGGQEQFLIEAAQRDPARFAEIYDLYFDRVYAFISRRVFNRSDAEDLTSEVFHQALASLGRFEFRGAPFSAWLYRIAANTIADHVVRLSREGRAPEVDEPTETELCEIDHHVELQRLVKRLPADQRRVVALRFVDEKSVAEIVRELGRSEGAVRQLQFRALRTLRARLDGAEGGREGRRVHG